MAKQPKAAATDAGAETEAATSKTKKEPRAIFVNEAGETSRNPSADTVAVESRYASDTGLETIRRATSDFTPDIQGLLAWHGLKQLMGDARASEAKVGAEATHESLSARLERMDGGDWVKEGEAAGPRVTLILEAVVRVKAEAGDEMDESRIAAAKEKLKDKAVRESTLAHLAYKAAYETIKAERQQARAKVAAEKAAAEGADAVEAPAF